MTEASKTIFNDYQIRKTGKQKTAFIEYIKQFSESKGFKLKVEKGTFGCRNIVIGNPDTAKVVYTAHYDTCPVLPFPNFITPKKIHLYILYQLLITVGMLTVFFASLFTVTQITSALLNRIGVSEAIINVGMFVVFWIMYFWLLFLLLAGPENKHTANDNTSGVITLVEIMSNLPDDSKDSFAFVFFDLEECGLFGSSSFASKHKAAIKNKLLLNFDCVSDGKNVLIALKKDAVPFSALLEKCFVSNEAFKVDIRSKNVFYPSDQANFKCGAGIATLKYSEFFKTEYMDRIHTKNDVIFEEDNIEYLTACSLNIVKELTTETEYKGEKSC